MALARLIYHREHDWEKVNNKKNKSRNRCCEMIRSGSQSVKAALRDKGSLTWKGFVKHVGLVQEWKSEGVTGSRATETMTDGVKARGEEDRRSVLAAA